MKPWVIWLVLGIVMMIAGVTALLNPFAATLTAVQIVSWVFLFGGLLQIVGVFQAETLGQRILSLLLAAINIWLGITLLSHPLGATIALTVMVAILFLASGVTKAGYALLALRGTAYFWMVLLSGIVSAVLGAMILSNIPQSAATILGILLAVELISTAVSLIAMALVLRKVPPEDDATKAA